MQELYLRNGTLFAREFIRLEKGGRGNYYELNSNQILVPLVTKFNKSPWSEDQVTGNESFYYYWLQPQGSNEKVYFQLKGVNYATYHAGLYYIAENAVFK